MFHTGTAIKNPRKVHGHEDGLGLNDLISIEADQRDPNAGGSTTSRPARVEVMTRQRAIERAHRGVLGKNEK
jgi:hypothetical protein